MVLLDEEVFGTDFMNFKIFDFWKFLGVLGFGVFRGLGFVFSRF